jgi:hypothetical protein
LPELLRKKCRQKIFSLIIILHAKEIGSTFTPEFIQIQIKVVRTLKGLGKSKRLKVIREAFGLVKVQRFISL